MPHSSVFIEMIMRTIYSPKCINAKKVFGKKSWNVFFVKLFSEYFVQRFLEFLIVRSQRKRKVLQSFHYLIEFIDAKIREIITVINLTFGKALPHKVAVCTNWPFKQTSLLYYLHNRIKYFLMQHFIFQHLHFHKIFIDLLTHYSQNSQSRTPSIQELF